MTNKVRRLPEGCGSLWTAAIEPSLTGSGALPPPDFSRRPVRVAPTPKIDELIEAFSTPVDLNRLDGWYP